MMVFICASVEVVVYSKPSIYFTEAFHYNIEYRREISSEALRNVFFINM